MNVVNFSRVGSLLASLLLYVASSGASADIILRH
jgi:hypothetical protein